MEKSNLGDHENNCVGYEKKEVVNDEQGSKYLGEKEELVGDERGGKYLGRKVYVKNMFALKMMVEKDKREGYETVVCCHGSGKGLRQLTGRVYWMS